MQLPREPRAGETLDFAWGQQVIRYLRSITPRSGPGVRVNGGGGGTTFSASIVARQPSASHPFKVLNASTATEAKVRVVFGQVNSITPTIATVALGTDPAPELTVVSGVVYLKITVDEETGVVSTAEIGNAATLPASTVTEGYLTLAEVTVASDAVTAINQAVTHSLGSRRCGTNDYHFWGL